LIKDIEVKKGRKEEKKEDEDLFQCSQCT